MDKKLKDAAVGTGALVGTVVVGPVAAVVKPGADIVQFLWGRATESRRKAMLDGLLAAVAEAGNYDASESEGRLNMLLSDCTEEQEELIYESFRAMAFGKSRDAWPIICRLTAHYVVKKGGKPDKSFKRLARFLERCEDMDLKLLREALAASTRLLSEADPSLPPKHVSWQPVGGGLSLSAHSMTTRSARVTAGGDHGRQLVNLLVDSRIASTGQHGELLVTRVSVASLTRLFRT